MNAPMNNSPGRYTSHSGPTKPFTFSNRIEASSVTEVVRFTGGGDMDCYVAELDEDKRIAAVWIRKRNARGPSIFDPRKHVFDDKTPSEFVGAPIEDIKKWLTSKQLQS